VVIAEITVRHDHGSRLDGLVENLALAHAARRDRPGFGHLVEDRKVQVQAHGPSRTGRGRPSHARHCAQQRAIDGGQGGQSLPRPRVAPLALAQGLLGQAAHHLIQHLGSKLMLRGRKGRWGNGSRTDLAHLDAMTGVAEGAQAGHHRVEHREKEGAKIILRKEGATLVSLRRGERPGRQERQHLLAKAVQELPVVQLILGNGGALGHAASRPEVRKKYKLQLCDDQATNERQDP
jgi:hypothetical protein